MGARDDHIERIAHEIDRPCRERQGDHKHAVDFNEGVVGLDHDGIGRTLGDERVRLAAEARQVFPA